MILIVDYLLLILCWIRSLKTYLFVCIKWEILLLTYINYRRNDLWYVSPLCQVHSDWVSNHSILYNKLCLVTWYLEVGARNLLKSSKENRWLDALNCAIRILKIRDWMTIQFGNGIYVHLFEKPIFSGEYGMYLNDFNYQSIDHCRYDRYTGKMFFDGKKRVK